MIGKGTSSSCPTAQSGKESHSRVVVKSAAHMPCSEFPYEFCGCLLCNVSCVLLGCSASGARRGQQHSSCLCESLSLAFSLATRNSAIESQRDQRKNRVSRANTPPMAGQRSSPSYFSAHTSSRKSFCIKKGKGSACEEPGGSTMAETDAPDQERQDEAQDKMIAEEYKYVFSVG